MFTQSPACVDYHALITDSEDASQRALCHLSLITEECNLSASLDSVKLHLPWMPVGTLQRPRFSVKIPAIL